MAGAPLLASARHPTARMRDRGWPRQTSRASPVSGEAVGWEYDTVLVGRQEGAWVVAGERGSLTHRRGCPLRRMSRMRNRHLPGTWGRRWLTRRMRIRSVRSYRISRLVVAKV